MVDKHVVITGATGGLGQSVVAELLARGAICHLPVREAVLPAAIPWASSPRVRATPGVALDDEEAVTRYFGSLPPLWASIHLVGGFAAKSLIETTLADLNAQFQLNTVTCFLCCREAVRNLRGGGGGGRLVNVAARPALLPVGGLIAYAAAKAAVASITQSLAVEVLGDKILVNAVVPSIIDTPANRAAMPSADFSRWPKADELARAIVYLASEDNAVTSGTLLPVFGQA
jgi:NAD(P)-dependent dehydrogenase (short-subunit alcohol dehydrogenase family)